jgi:hypothetical protein
VLRERAVEVSGEQEIAHLDAVSTIRAGSPSRRRQRRAGPWLRIRDTLKLLGALNDGLIRVLRGADRRLLRLGGGGFG